MASPVQSPELQLDLGRYTLVRGGRNVRLEKQPMELLILLVEKRGQLVTRDEIVARLWGDGIFLDTERSINTAVRKIRLALHDHPDHPRVIETVVGKGYRFIAPIKVVPAEPAAIPTDFPPAVRSKPQRKWFTWAITILVVLVCAALVSSVLARKWLRNAVAQKPINSIAVLPLQNLSGDPAQEYFADGMTEALITDVAKISGLRVISHTSVMHYKGTSKTLPEIARELKVDAVIEGSVARSSGRVRITAQLLEGPTDRHLWAEAYERSTSDVLMLQDEVARAIARQVQARLLPERAEPRHSHDAEAQDAYFKGVYEADKFTAEGLKNAVENFREAVGRDPQFAQAWAGLAHACNLQFIFHYVPETGAKANAEAAAAKAIQLDEHLSEAHASLGEVLVNRKQWSAAEKHYRRGIELNPSNALAHQNLGYLLSGPLGRADEGIQEMARALDLDPLSTSKKNSLGAAFLWAHRYNDALRIFHELPDGDANTERRHRRMADIYDRKGMQQDAVEEWARAMEVSGRPSIGAAVQRLYRTAGYGAARKAFFAGDLMDRVPKAMRGDHSLYFWVAIDHTILGDYDNAFHWLEKTLSYGDHALLYIKADDEFDNLRGDSRYPELLRRLGLT